jgi:chromosome segregation ATPase
MPDLPCGMQAALRDATAKLTDVLSEMKQVADSVQQASSRFSSKKQELQSREGDLSSLEAAVRPESCIQQHAADSHFRCRCQRDAMLALTGKFFAPQH